MCCLYVQRMLQNPTKIGISHIDESENANFWIRPNLEIPTGISSLRDN